MESLYVRKAVVIGLLDTIFSGLIYYFQSHYLESLQPTSSNSFLLYFYVTALFSNFQIVLLAILASFLIYPDGDKELLLKKPVSLLAHLFLVIFLRLLISVIVALVLKNIGINIDPTSFLGLFLIGLKPLYYFYPGIYIGFLTLFVLFSYLVRSFVLLYACVLGLYIWSNARHTSSPSSPTWSRFGGFVVLFVISAPVSNFVRSFIIRVFVARLLSIQTFAEYSLAVNDLLYVVFQVFSVWLITQMIDDRTQSSLQLNNRVQYLLTAGIFVLLSFYSVLNLPTLLADQSVELLTFAGLNILLVIVEWTTLILVLVTLQHGIPDITVPVEQELLYQAPINQYSST